MVLFTCAICKYGHSVMNVSCFISKDNRYVYYCKEHKHLAPDTSIYVPWDDEKPDYDYNTYSTRPIHDTYIITPIKDYDLNSHGEETKAAQNNDLSNENSKK